MVRQVIDEDFEQIAEWFADRGCKMGYRNLFPNTGFIVDGIAAGFVYFTDSAVAIIDSFISNKHSNAVERDAALDAITASLIVVARAKGCRIIKCDTQLEAIKNRAKKFGFNPTGSYESFKLELNHG